MPRKLRFFIFLALSLFSLVAALILTLGQIDRYDISRTIYPSGTVIAGIPVGNLDAQAAGLRLIQAYIHTPLELRIAGTVVQIDPAVAGVQLDLQKMLDASGKNGEATYWKGFWNFLWNRSPQAMTNDLACSVSSELLHAYLQEKISPYFTRQATPANPVPGDVIFRAGQPGEEIDLAAKEEEIRTALCQLAPRTVEVGTKAIPPLPPTIEDLHLALEALTQVSGFDGIIEIYFQDLASGKEINFAYNQGRPVNAEIAFTGASTIKIPVMISAYKHIDGSLPEDLRRKMEEMIDLSDNASTDEVMKQSLDENIAPVQVTQDMQALGIKNTFLAGFFYAGAPLLERYQTPANQRTDLTTDPDIYNQTTTADMGRLLAAIQRCAADGSGLLLDTFQGQVSQAECQEMIDLLKKNRKGVLVEAGLPEGTQLAHKYGWVTDANDGLLHTASDAAIVYTPGGNFVLTAYLYHPDQLPWDDAQRLVASLATTIYNFYNDWQKE
jgi:beta-lactamase class A